MCMYKIIPKLNQNYASIEAKVNREMVGGGDIGPRTSLPTLRKDNMN